MRRFCLAPLLVILITGCKPKLPATIIQPDKLRLILYDMHVADGYVSTITIPDSAKKVAASYYKAVYKKYNIDSALYTKSMNYYYDHVNTLVPIYADVTKQLKKTKDSIDKIQAKKLEKEEAEAKLKRDSADRADPKLIAARADSVKKAKNDSITKVKLELKTKMLAEKKAKKDSADKAKPKRLRKTESPRKAN